MIISVLGNGLNRPTKFSHVGDLPDNCYLSGIKTKEFKGRRYNQLRFDDTPSQISAQLASEHAHSQLNLGYLTQPRQDGHGDHRGEGFELRTDKWGTMRAGRGPLDSTWERLCAVSKTKEMPETHARLTDARSIHEELAHTAQQDGAQANTHHQGEVAHAIKEANASLRGQGSESPEFETPDIAITSAANLHASAEGNAHVASGRHMAFSAGGSVAIAALKSLFASVRDTIALYASKAVTILSPGGRAGGIAPGPT